MNTSTIIWIIIAIVVVVVLLAVLRMAAKNRQAHQHRRAVAIRSEAEEEYREAREKLAHADKIDPAVKNRRSADDGRPNAEFRDDRTN